MALKIALLVNNFVFRKWQIEIIEYILKHPNLKLSLIVENKEELKNKRSSFCFRLLSFIDRKTFKVKDDAFSVVDFYNLKEKINTISIRTKCAKFSLEFHEQDLKIIRGYKLDILIRFGFGIIKGEILNSARYGVWSLHHGDNKVNRGGPPAFWEVVNKELVTGITLQRLSEDLDGGQVIRKAFIKTDTTSFYRNQNAAFWAGVELFTSALNDLSKGHFQFQFENDSGIDHKSFSLFYSYPLYRNPSNHQSLKIFSSFWKRRISEFLNEKYKQSQWALYYKYKKEGKSESSLFRYKKLIPPKGYDWADPFVVAQRDSYFIFFEELQQKKRKAHISYLEFNGSGILQSNKPIKVLQEPFHLSYPFILEEENELYMIPEAGESNEVWIYKCEGFPDKWRKFYKIFSNKALYDPTLFKYNNLWYLFGTEKVNPGSSPDQYLHIYYSSGLYDNEWKPHPQNPITRDVRGARPAGKIFQWNDKWIRPAQIGTPKYGYGIQFNEIIKLTETEYQERIVDSILPEWTNGLLAAHTINFEQGFSVVDAQGKK